MSFATMHPWRWFAHQPKISLQIENVENSFLKLTEKRLNFWLGVCGCQAGAVFVLASLAWIVFGSGGFASTLTAVLYACAIVIGAGIAGKISAILGARAMFIADAALFSWRADRFSHAAQQKRMTT